MSVILGFFFANFLDPILVLTSIAAGFFIKKNDPKDYALAGVYRKAKPIVKHLTGVAKEQFQLAAEEIAKEQLE